MDYAWIGDLQALLRAGREVILVSVVKTEGSVPREIGARLLVSKDEVLYTIGGGHLEWVAIKAAREWLMDYCSKQRKLERYSLGASLGQCCGGVVTLAFERLTSHDLSWVDLLVSSIRNKYAVCRELVFPAPETDKTPNDLSVKVSAKSADGHKSSCELQSIDGDFVFVKECICSDIFNLILFGAGHVGRALVNILATLPCSVTWVDERENEFPEKLPSNVIADINDDPERVIALAPDGSYFLVMTHSHLLDQKISESILSDGRCAYFGMIGSKTKRQKFEHRLLERGIKPDRLNLMTCPIGVSGIKGKEPAVIAVAVAAELLQVYSARSSGYS